MIFLGFCQGIRLKKYLKPHYNNSMVHLEMIKKLIDTNNIEDEEIAGKFNIKCFFADSDNDGIERLVINDVANDRKASLPISLIPDINEEIRRIKKEKKNEEFKEKLWQTIEKRDME